MTPSARLATVAALPLLVLVVAACNTFPGFPETSTLRIVNKTTVPVSLEDRGSRRIIEPCSERTIEYHGTWGGDPETDQPLAESVPADVHVVPFESQFTRPFEYPLHISIVVDAKYGAHSLDSMPELMAEPCAGVPPASASPTASR